MGKDSKRLFFLEISTAINRNCAENGSNTPDYILAEFLKNCLNAFDKAVRARERWYGRSNKPFPPKKLKIKDGK